MDSNMEQLRTSLSKGIETIATDVAQGMALTYDDEIAFKTFQYSPLLNVLDSKGRCQDVDTANVAFFKEAPTNDAAFINETENIPAFAVTTYTEVADRMKTIAEGISISRMAQMGTDYVDLLEREIQRAYFQVNSLIDSTLLTGAGTAAAKDFKSVIGATGINSDDADGPVTEGIIDDMLSTIIDNNGGHPDILVTDNFVAKQLKAIAAPYRRFNDKVDIGLGFRVSTYESPDGMEIPIVVDKNMPTADSGASHSIAVLDSSAIEVKYLMRPSLITDLPAQNLAYNQAVASYVTAMNVAPFKCGVISGIAAE
jgi:hypothetical protein